MCRFWLDFHETGPFLRLINRAQRHVLQDPLIYRTLLLMTTPRPRWYLNRFDYFGCNCRRIHRWNIEVVLYRCSHLLISRSSLLSLRVRGVRIELQLRLLRRVWIWLSLGAACVGEAVLVFSHLGATTFLILLNTCSMQYLRFFDHNSRRVFVSRLLMSKEFRLDLLKDLLNAFLFELGQLGLSFLFNVV